MKHLRIRLYQIGTVYMWGKATRFPACLPYIMRYSENTAMSLTYKQNWDSAESNDVLFFKIGFILTALHVLENFIVIVPNAYGMNLREL